MDIPKINSNKDSVPSQGAQPQSSTMQVNSEEGSVLVPKVGVKEKFSHKFKRKKRPEQQGPKKKWRPGKKFKISLAIFSVLLLITLGVSAFVGNQVYGVYKSGLLLKEDLHKLVFVAQSQDLVGMKNELENTKGSLANFTESYEKIVWMNSLPYVGKYVEDGQHGLVAAEHGIKAGEIVLVAVEPYADILGLAPKTGDGPADGNETAQDRLDFVVSTIPELIPKADELTKEVAIIQKEIAEINPEDYPEEFQGFAVRENLKMGTELVATGSEFVKNGKPLLEAAPAILGTEDERTYLVIFQNDKELRATGGFITAYSVANVTRGKFEPVSSSDIYHLDSNYTPSVKAPDPVIDYLQGPYRLSRNLRLRDMNWSPDFAESMELFSEEASKAGLPEVDGIIAVDTQLLVNILEVIGPIGVPGYGNFSAENDDRCNCPQVVYELESFADVEGAIVWDQNDPTKIIFAPPNYENRKEIIGPLMNSVLSNMLGQSSEKIPGLFEAGFKSVNEKHVLVYMHDENEQDAVSTFGIGGTIKDYDGDYLHVNDSNFGGRKSNMYVTHEVQQTIDVAKDGTITKTLNLTYSNPEPHDGWLNSTLPNWMRVYVPEGSELIDMQGVEDATDPYNENGKTVYAGLVEVRPKGVAKVTIQYKLPFKFDDMPYSEDGMYNILVQKQAGKDAPLYGIEIGKGGDELFLLSDKEFKFKV